MKKQNHSAKPEKTQNQKNQKRIWKTPEIIEEDFSQTKAQVPPPPQAPGQGSS